MRSQMTARSCFPSLLDRNFSPSLRSAEREACDVDTRRVKELAELKARAKNAESRAKNAESRAKNAESRAKNAEARAIDAEARAIDAEARAKNAEAAAER